MALGKAKGESGNQYAGSVCASKERRRKRHKSTSFDGCVDEDFFELKDGTKCPYSDALSGRGQLTGRSPRS